MCMIIIATSSAIAGLSPSTVTAVVPYSAPDTVIDLESLVPDTHVPGKLLYSVTNCMILCISLIFFRVYCYSPFF